MAEADPFDALLSAWEEGQRCGEEIPPEELARACPELIPELRRRIGALRQMGRLAEEARDARCIISSPDRLLPRVAEALTDLERTGSYHSATDDGSEVQTTDSAGPTLGEYELLEPVRPWQCGTVYAAQHSRLRRAVRVRVLDEGYSADPATRADFARSAQALAQLTHPNLAGAILEVCPDGPTPYLVLDADPGTPLTGFGPRDWLGRQREGLYPNRQLAQALLDAARGLQAVHRAGLSHGNLRPDVIRLDPSRSVVLAGLGDMDTQVAEAAPFAAPLNLAAGDARQRDLYALGATFYFLATGARPEAPDPPPVKRLNPGVSREVSGILASSLATDSGHRYATADALVADLERMLGTETVLAPPPRRALMIFESLGVLFAGMILGVAAFVVLHIVGVRHNPGTPHLTLLLYLAVAPMSVLFLYWLGTETFLGGTLLRRRQGIEVVDLAGEPASLARRLTRTVLKLGLAVGLGAVFAQTIYAYAVAALGISTQWLLLVSAALGVCTGWLSCAIVSGPSILLFRYRLGVLGERLTTEDFVQMMHLQLHDRFTDTRLVVRRSTAVQPVPNLAAPTVETPNGPATKRIGPYDLGPPLGKGGMGAVYRAWDRALGRPVALKLLGEHLLDQPLAQDRFEREARLAAQLNHPNVAKVYGAGRWDGTLYIAMELIDGETLEQRVRRRGPLPLAEAWRYLIQAAEALQAADRLGIVHRDIKPSNLMVTPQGTLKVADFGVSHRFEGEVRLTGTGAVVGTPLYMAPEQARGQPVDHRADMYSLGMTLYFLLAGRPAFAAGNPLDLLAHQLGTAPPSLAGQVPGLTDAQDAILSRLLALRKEDRYADYDALLGALRTEAPEQAPAAPFNYRFCNGFSHLLCCSLLLIYLVLLARWGLPAVLPVGWATGLADVNLSSPGLLLTWQILATLLTVLVVVYRPWLPFGPQGTWTVRDLGRCAGNTLFGLLAHSLFGWPLSQRLQGLRVIDRTGRRVRIGRATLRFAVTYPLLLPWAWLAYLPGLSVEAVAWPLGWVNLGLFALSWLIMLRHPDRRHLGDLIAGTRVVRVVPIVSGQAAKVPTAKALVAFALDALWMCCLFIGPWVGSQFWLQSLRHQHEAQQEATLKVLNEARTLAQQGKYEEALQKHLWFHENALKHMPALVGVRLSYALADWIKLGEKYPKAKGALVAIRDQNVKTISEGNGSFQLFHDVVAINSCLNEEPKTVELFKTLHEKQPDLAKACYHVSEKELAARREYQICISYIPDPLKRFDRIRKMRELNLKLAKDNRPQLRDYAERSFVEETSRLIEILVGAGRKADAEKVQEQALAVRDDPGIREAVEKAVQRQKK
jgi:serine/threonine protein kinase/uncharacterized RDD family membrane protein YckC